MIRLRNLNLSTRINLVIAAILLLFFCISIALDYRAQQDFVTRASVARSRIVATHVIEAREYISAQLVRGNVSLDATRFGLIPVVASDRIAAQVGDTLGYKIRQVSSRYRNPRNAPDAFETTALQRFINEAELTEVYAFVSSGKERVFRYLKPFRVDASCLECHGDPAQAPAFIRSAYPPATADQSYHYRIGEIIGAASVTIPLADLDQQALTNLRSDIAQTGAIFLALVICLGLLIRTVVTRPLAQLGKAIETVERTGQFDRRLPPRGEDEVGTLTAGFNRMMERLEASVGELEESERRFRLLTETAHDAIVCCLANGQIILFNHQAERLFGYRASEAIGMRGDQLIHPDCPGLDGKSLEELLATDTERLLRATVTLVGRHRDGRALPLSLSLSVADSDGHSFYTAIIRERE